MPKRSRVAVGLAFVAVAEPFASAQLAGAPASGVQGGTITTAERPSEELIAAFVKSSAEPLLIGQMARWRDGFCPQTFGTPPPSGAYVVQRVREVAANGGAPAQPASCGPIS